MSQASTEEVGPVAAYVTSAEGLRAAVARRDPHIQITAHLDLRTEGGGVAAAPVGDGFLPPALRVAQDTLLIMRGNCTGSAPADLLQAATGIAPTQPVRKNQCVVLVDSGFLRMDGAASLWLDGVFVLVRRTVTNSAVVLGTTAGDEQSPPRRVWLTDTTIQGDSEPTWEENEGLIWGLSLRRAATLVERCSFAHLGGRGDAAPIDLTATTGTFSNCAFRDNFVDTHTSGVIRGRTATTATTRNCTFSGNSGQGQLLHASPSSTDAPPASELAARFFSDDASLRFCDITDGYSQVTEVEAVSRAEATMRQSLLHMQTEAGLIERPLPAQSPLPAKPNMMGCCSIQCGDSDRDGGGGILPATAPSAAFADTPAGVDSGAVLSSEVGQDASEGGGGDEGLSLNSRAGVGLAAAALVIAALALVAVVAYAVRLRQRRRRQLEWRRNKRQMSAAAEADPVEGLEVSTPRSMEDSGGVSLSFFYNLKTPSKFSESGSRNILQDPSIDLHPAAHLASSTLATGGAQAGPPSGPSSTPSASDAVSGEMTAAVDAGAGGESFSEHDWSSVDYVATGAPAMCSRSGEMRAQSLAIEALSGTTFSNQEVGDLGAVTGGAGQQPLARVASGGWVRPMLQSAKDLGPVEETAERGWVAADADTTTSDAVPPLPPVRTSESAQMQARLMIVGQQLDAFWPRGVLLERYQMLGNGDRCQGGRAVVQMVRSPLDDQLYAIKFFGSRAAFQDARRLHLHETLGRFMPAVIEFVANENDVFCDPFDHPMPPCVVMENGESLTHRAVSCRNDAAASAQILGQVASCLGKLHSQGWVHRDLKPDSVMFLPRTGTWTLINFGLAARTGEAARVGFTLGYAAPEVVAAHAAGDAQHATDPAADAWALGVMAFELLTGRPAFPTPVDSAEVRRQLLGQDPLPWEGDRLTHSLRRRLGTFKAPVLRMLCRDPARRATCEQLATALRRSRSPASSPGNRKSPRWTPA